VYEPESYKMTRDTYPRSFVGLSRAIFITEVHRMIVYPLIKSFLMVTTSLFGSISLSQNKGFITVDGPDLSAKLATAIKKAAGASRQTRFWVAYTFALRPEATIDPTKGEFIGDKDDISTLSVFIARASNSPGGTKNVGVFLLYDPGGKTVARVELYNLDRQTKYAGFPVYWLGLPPNPESLSFLRGVINANPMSKVAENATLALALHDDPGVSDMLKEQAQTSTDLRARKTAVHWLGFIGRENSFLEGLIVGDQVPTPLRKAAALALGESSAPVQLSTLTRLYATPVPLEVRRTLLYSISINADQAAVLEFLHKVADSDVDAASKKQARYWLNEKAEARR
jgi:hypothetical protein